MRRIYDSDALRRDEGHFTPKSADRGTIVPRSHRWIPSRSLGEWFVPSWIHRRAIRVAIDSPRSTYHIGDDIPLRITLKNSLPIPVSISTTSPIVWNWYVNEHPAAEKWSPRSTTDGDGRIEFDRGERKQFNKRWSQLFRISPTEWKPATPGTYTIAAGISVSDPKSTGLWDEIVITIVE